MILVNLFSGRFCFVTDTARLAQSRRVVSNLFVQFVRALFVRPALPWPFGFAAPRPLD
jgi:hypothetical protein